MYVLGFNNAGPVVNECTRQLSMFFAGGGLSETAINTITNAVETCMDDMGKGVVAMINPLDQLNDLMIIQYLAFEQRIQKYEKRLIDINP